MTIEEISKIINANPTNKYIIQHLDENTVELILEIMEKLNSSDFREISADAEFELSDIPIPYEKLQKQVDSTSSFSKGLQKRFKNLLKEINNKGTNIEYPFIMKSNNNSNEYSQIKEFENGGSQTCDYDWNFIEDFIKNSDDKISLSLLHTHPNPLDSQHNTLFNRYPEEMSELGVKPNGLNISLADVYAQQYLEMLINKYGKDITAESTILMHDGTLISFSTQSGLSLTHQQKIEMTNSKEIIL